MRRGLADPHKGSLDERRRCRRIEGAERLRPGKRRSILQDAWWGLIQMHEAGGDLEKVERST